MTPLLPRRSGPRLRLDPESYRRLCKQVLERDGWRCQHCGRLTQLQVHHVSPRSRLGDDVEQNLIALCASCHQGAHLRKTNANS
ncbi:MAG: HNH endonuclease [Acidobacteria bacterium]|nr:HNH endonuclease [Acidobacteriota bacterium]